MATVVRGVLSSTNRLFFLITLAVFLLILYLLHQLGEANPSQIQTKILPNYDRSLHDIKKGIPDEPFNRNFETDNIRTTVKPHQDESAIFYIDPPDKPVIPARKKHPLVGKNLQNPKIDNFRDEENEIETEREDADLVHYDHDDESFRKQNKKDVNVEEFEHPVNANKDNSVKDHDEKRFQNYQQFGKLGLPLQTLGNLNSEALAQEWQKLREEKHKLLEDKIRWQKEMGQSKSRDQMDLLYRRHLPPTDAREWQGLNSSVVELQYPGVLFSREYKVRRFIDLADKMAAGMERKPTSVDNMTDGQAEDRFYQLLTMTHLDCGEIKRLGNTDDGGWDICVVEPFLPKPGCIAYSFGINYDFTFDDGLAETFGCQVRTFDPSMLIGDHMHLATVYFYQLGLGAANTVNDKGWRLETMGSIMQKLGHLNKTIDILKLDIEFNEWSCLRTMLKEGVLRNFKQLLMEVHTPEVYTVGRPGNKQDFIMMYDVLYNLEKQGFRKYHFTYNPLGKYTSVRTGKVRSCCYELYFVNIRFLKF